jgi:hypothetical protein
MGCGHQASLREKGFANGKYVLVRDLFSSNSMQLLDIKNMELHDEVDCSSDNYRSYFCC